MTVIPTTLDPIPEGFVDVIGMTSMTGVELLVYMSIVIGFVASLVIAAWLLVPPADKNSRSVSVQERDQSAPMEAKEPVSKPVPAVKLASPSAPIKVFPALDPALVASVKGALGPAVGTNELPKIAAMFGSFPLGHPIRQCGDHLPDLKEAVQAVTPLPSVDEARRALMTYMSSDDERLERIAQRIRDAVTVKDTRPPVSNINLAKMRRDIERARAKQSRRPTRQGEY